MKKKIFLTLLLCAINTVIAQEKEELINQIRTQYNWINKQEDFVIIELNANEYLDQAPDNGSSLKGYLKNNTLYKIVEWFGPSYAIMITEYYLWDNELIFVYDIEKNFHQIIDDKDGFIEFDYSKTEVKYESRHYYSKGKKIKFLEKGKRLMDLSVPKNFKDNLLLYKLLFLNNKK